MSSRMQLRLGGGVTSFSRIERWPSGFHNGPQALQVNNLTRIRLRTRRVSCGFNCVAALASTESSSRTAEGLRDEYGCMGLNFFESAGTIVADLKLESGSKARLLLSTAQITSYKAHMWHGGEEEMLHTVRTGKGADSQRGGINLGFIRSVDPPSSILPSSSVSWNVEDARCEPMNYAQITLTSNSEFGTMDADRGCLQFRYVVTLTNNSLSSAVIVTNTGLLPVEFTGSIVSHLAVSSVEGTFAVGLNRCRYLSLSSSPTKQFNKRFGNSNFFPPIWDHSEQKKMLGGPVAASSHSEITASAQELERGSWREEKEDYSGLRKGESRLYPTPPSSFTFLDRGYRRSLIVQRIGFQEFWLSNVGSAQVRDWDRFICLGPTQNFQPVILQANEEWRAAQVLANPGNE